MSNRIVKNGLVRIGIVFLSLLVPSVSVSFSRGHTADESARTPRTTPLDTQTVEDLVGVHYYGIYLGGQKVGWAKSEFALVSNGGETRWRSSFEHHTRWLFNGEIGWMSHERQWDFDTQEPFALSKVRFFDIDDDNSREVVMARQQEGPFLAVIRDGNETIQKTLPAFEYTLADELSNALWIRQGPEVGDVDHSLGFDSDELVFEPTVSEVLEIKTELVGDLNVPVYEIELQWSQDGNTERIRINEAGNRLSHTFAGSDGLRIEPELVAKDVGVGIDLTKLDKTPVDWLLGDPKLISRVVLEITGEYLPDLKSTDGQVVKRQDGRLIVTLANGVGEPLYPSPNEIRECLAATLSYPSDHERIRALAKEAIGDAKTDTDKVRHLVSFVSDFVVDWEMTETSTIWKLLNEPVGDCAEHALLFTVLARATGLPAREVSGWVYLGDEDKALGHHAWNEVVINGQWVEVDPTWDEFPISTVRIRLEATPEEAIASFAAEVNGLKIRVLELERIPEQKPRELPFPLAYLQSLFFRQANENDIYFNFLRIVLLGFGVCFLVVSKKRRARFARLQRTTG